MFVSERGHPALLPEFKFDTNPQHESRGVKNG